jgi:hypothetical protein
LIHVGRYNGAQDCYEPETVFTSDDRVQDRRVSMTRLPARTKHIREGRFGPDDRSGVAIACGIAQRDNGTSDDTLDVRRGSAPSCCGFRRSVKAPDCPLRLSDG